MSLLISTVALTVIVSAVLVESGYVAAKYQFQCSYPGWSVLVEMWDDDAEPNANDLMGTDEDFNEPQDPGVSGMSGVQGFHKDVWGTNPDPFLKVYYCCGIGCAGSQGPGHKVRCMCIPDTHQDTKLDDGAYGVKHWDPINLDTDASPLVPCGQEFH